MKRIEIVSRGVLSNISKNFGDIQWLRPLKEVKNVVINNKPTTVHVARIGISEDDDCSDVLVYIDGYGGLIIELNDEIYSYREDGKVKIRPIKVLKENGKLVLAINPHTEYVYPDIKYMSEHKSYGYVHRAGLVLVDLVNSKDPIQVEVNKAAAIVDLQQIIDMAHPNLVVYGPENMEWLLMLYNEHGTDRENLYDSWHCEDHSRVECFKEIRTLIEKSSDTKEVARYFREWWNKEGREKYSY